MRPQTDESSQDHRADPHRQQACTFCHTGCLWADELVVLLVSYWDGCFLHGVTWNRLRSELERPPLLPASLPPQLVITYSLLRQFLKINRSAEESLCVLHVRGANGLCV